MTLRVDITNKKSDINNIEVPKFTLSPEKLVDKSAIFYGPSGSGKTALIYDIMYNCRHIFPKVLVFAPTNQEKHDYDNLVPKELIYEEFGVKDIKNIYDHQKAAADVYNTANKEKTLCDLFERVATKEHKTHRDKIFRQKQSMEIAIDTKFNLQSERKLKREELEIAHSKNIISFYKKVIKANKQMFDGFKLSQDEQTALKYINFNPRVLIIFDDAMTEIMALIREGSKNNNDVIKDFFFKGRWAYITHFYAFQDDNRLDSAIKKNAFYSIFTNPNVARAFFGRNSVNFSGQEKIKAEAIIEKVFKEDDEKHRKLVYNRVDAVHPFQYAKAELHDDFEMCSKGIRDYCKQIEKNEFEVDRNNPHFKRFTE